jgi:multidrug efflux pump subunit AcrA (membrane-fusion protein)
MFRRFLLAASAFGLMIGMTLAQDAPKGPDKPESKPDTKTEKPKAPTAKVERGTIKNEASFKGVFEATEMIEVNLKPEVWTSFPVLKSIEAGTVVKPGDVLIEFDPEKIDKAIKEMEYDQKMAEFQMKSMELDMPLAERSNPLDMASAERAYKHAKEDYEKWEKVDKKLQIDSMEFSLRSSQQQVENQKEELKQLEKMYRSKDLTEETEEIILKRQRFAVEQSEHFLRLTKNRRDQVINVDIPRREREMKDGLERAEIAYTKAKNTIPMSLDQKKLSMDKAKYERERSKEKFANIKKDRELFTVKAPAAGVVYYGKCVQGNWTGSAAKLQKGGSVMGDEVFMTIIKPGSLFVRGSVDEKDAKSVTAGQACKLTTPAFPDAKITGTIEKISPVPVGGNYEVKVKLGSNGVAVIPGMSAQVKVITYEKKDALTLPASCVFADDGDDDKQVVYKPATGGGKPEKVAVKAGKKAGGKAEILDGLKEGDEVLLTKPGKPAGGEG